MPPPATRSGTDTVPAAFQRFSTTFPVTSSSFSVTFRQPVLGLFTVKYSLFGVLFTGVNVHCRVCSFQLCSLADVIFSSHLVTFRLPSQESWSPAVFPEQESWSPAAFPEAVFLWLKLPNVSLERFGDDFLLAVYLLARNFSLMSFQIRYLLLARMLRLIRLLMHVQRYRGFVATFLTLIPSLMPYLGIIFCVLCFYCSLGVQIFGGIVNAGNPELEATALADNDYLLFNFNDYPNGMVTLFNILVTGVWQELMESYKELTGTSWTYLYFISFYLITVLLLLNLIIAFVLEAFFAEMELESSENCDANDKEVEGDKHRRRRSVGTKTRSQRADALLHHMLSAELCQNQPSNT